mmetsp:Transcript_64715/g.179804  ORF Transcript_64715/g.179804 Transcript_64715/m.179804 type:complete len:516 (+) Transcript_64715:65-1612(+)
MAALQFDAPTELAVDGEGNMMEACSSSDDDSLSSDGAAAFGPPIARIAIAGAGFSGAILARQLSMEPNVEVICFEKSAQNAVRKHWTQPVTGAGLNINPNAMATLTQQDPELARQLRGIGLPRESVRASTLTGRQIYEQDMVKEGLADTHGCRVRWDDANTLIRSAAGGCIRWETTVDDHVVNEDGTIDITLGHADGSSSIERGFDLLVAGEGRYSGVRARATPNLETTFGNVCNFRILVPNAQPDGSQWPAEYGEAGLFDDLQLIYNDTPSMENLATDSKLRGDREFESCVMRSTPRVGIMRIPKSTFKSEVGESLYIFGNFAIPDGGDVPAGSKTAEAMHCMFTPAGGEDAMTPEGRFIRETLSTNATDLHWSRFQDISVQYSDESRGVLMLGDACHAFCPSLGQGATTSIEDACVAASELQAALRGKTTTDSHECVVAALKEAVGNISKRQSDRVSFIRDISTEVGNTTTTTNTITSAIARTTRWTRNRPHVPLSLVDSCCSRLGGSPSEVP